MNEDNPAELIPFSIDLTFEEARRRTEVVAALGPDWDPVAALQGEDEAYALLYSGLDAEQQRTYDMLVAAGVLPGPRPEPESGPESGEGPGPESGEGPGRAAAH